MSDEDDTKRGMYDKYRVIDLETGEEITEFFVLRFKDKFARAALYEYALKCSLTYPLLARDLLKALFKAQTMDILEEVNQRPAVINQGDIDG